VGFVGELGEKMDLLKVGMVFSVATTAAQKLPKD
jgi:hypothetical protein